MKVAAAPIPTEMSGQDSTESSLVFCAGGEWMGLSVEKTNEGKSITCRLLRNTSGHLPCPYRGYSSVDLEL